MDVRDEFQVTETAVAKIPRQRKRKSSSMRITKVPDEVLEYAKNLCKREQNRRYRIQRDGSVLVLNANLEESGT